jgi:hypothetical protein
MERIIIKNNKPSKTITSLDVEDQMSTNGIIIVYEETTIVGHVSYSFDDREWTIELIEDLNTFKTLEEILDEYPEFIFKFID